MKTKFFFGALALAAMSLASCSSDEPGVNTEKPTGDKYVAIQIHNVGSNGSRAGIADDDFETGFNTENAILPENCRFYFFDGDGNPFPLSVAGVNGTVSNTNMVRPSSLSTTTTNGGACTLTGVLVLGFPAEGNGYKGITPTTMVCAANLSNADFLKLADKSLLDLKNEISQVESGIVATDKFAMTSATYKVGETATYWTDITGCLKDTYKDAQDNPAHVYIERLSAKVRVNGLKAYVSLDKDGNEAIYKFYNPETGQTVDRKLYVELNGWQMRNIYNTVRLIKKVEGSNLPNFDWNYPDLHRSFWAVTGADANKLNSKTFNIYNPDHFYMGNYDEATTDAEKMAASRYIYPSTNWWKQPRTLNTISGTTVTTGTEAYPGNPVANRVTYATGIVVKGTVYFAGADGKIDKDAANDFVYHAGTYYMIDDFKAFVANAWNGHNDIVKATAADVTLETVSTTDNEGSTSGNNNRRVIKVKGETWSELGTVLYWNNGLCSFCVNIQHDTDNNGDPIFGIVRNHIYELTLSSVVGLGTPGNDITVPEDEKETFLACHIDVLNWHVVKNTIVLE